MPLLTDYANPASLPASTAARIAKLLGLRGRSPIDDVVLAVRVSEGLATASAGALGRLIGKHLVVGPVIPEATLRRAKKRNKTLSREMSERLYEVSRVVDAVSRVYHGDEDAIHRFLDSPHQLLGGRTPLAMARSSSAGAEAVINLLRRAESSFAA